MTATAFEDASDVAPLRTATRFGRYVLCYELASGGMGAVYLAKSEGPGGFEKLVALKRIHPHLARDPRFATMFLDEARIAARIHHPNVCGVHDFGEESGTFYLTMPYVVGEPLHRVMREASRAVGALGAMRPWMIARIVIDACEGLHAAHELRDETGRLLEVVHRDVSPQNVIVGYDGSARVLDFGVASARHRHYQTSTGEVKGKFAYLAPEQIDGKTADRRADVWALGVVLWEGITGQRLFARETMPAIVRAVTSDPIPPLASVVAVPDALQAVVDRALERDPARRYRTAREMGRDLLAVLSQHHVLGAADVGEWIEALFPEGRGESERLVEESRILSLSDVSGVALTGTMALPRRAVAAPRRPEPPEPTPLLEPSFLEPMLDSTSSSEPTPILEPTRSRPAPMPRSAVSHRTGGSLRRPMLVAVGALLLMGAGVAVGVALRPEPSRGAATSPAAIPPAPTITAPTITAPTITAPTITAPTITAPTTTAPTIAAPITTPTSTTPAESTNEVAAEAVPTTPEATPEEPPATTPQGRGSLLVATPGGWALVYRGRQRLGETPGTFTLPAGPQDVGIQPFGEGPIRRRRVVVPAGGVARLSLPIR